MAKQKAKLFIQDGCGWCEDAKKEIKRLEKAGQCCYDFEEVNITNLPAGKIPKQLDFTPMVLIGRKLMTFQECIGQCRVNKK